MTTGSQVETGAPLVRLEPVEDDADDEAAGARGGRPRPRPAAGRVRRDAAQERAARGRDGRRRDPDGLRRRPAATTASVIADYLAARDELVAAGEDVVPDEIELLGLFADLAELSRNRPAGEDLHTELRVHSSKEHFHAFLQSLDVDRGGLPDQFRDRLARVLAHYGVTDSDRTPELEEAVFRIFLAQQRSAPEVRLATELLQRWIAEPPPSRGAGRPGARPPRAARQVHPAPVPGRRRPGPQHPLPLVRPAAGRRRALQRAGRRPRRGRGPRGRSRRPGPDRADGGAGRDPGADRAVPRRAARGRRARSTSRCSRCWCAATTASTTCTTCGRSSRAGRTFAVADYALDDRPTRLVSTVGTIAELGRPATARWSRPSATRSPPATAGRRGGGRPLRALARRPGGAGAGQRGARPHRRRPALRPRRTPDRGGGLPRRGPAGHLLHLPSRSPTAAIVEDDLVRGVHPMVGRRLDLWRLRDFHVTRIEAPEDVLLYECVARENPADRRLVALAQVRQLAVVRDEEGTGHRRCPTRSGRWRTASRRSAASVRRAARPGASSTPTTCGCRSGRSSRPTSSS